MLEEDPQRMELMPGNMYNLHPSNVTDGSMPHSVWSNDRNA